jgi:transposase
MQPLCQQSGARLVDAVCLKHTFRQIQSNRSDRHCKRSPSPFGPIGIIAAGQCGGVHIINLLAGRRPAGMPKPYSQDLRDRVIDAVERGEMSRRAAARRYEISESVAIKWLERVERDGSRGPVGHGGHRASKLMPHRDFLEAARTEKPDITLQALCDRLLSERGVKADTSMMSRFFRRIGVTFKKRPSSRKSRIART